ncbi:hypothetical protein [Desertimonas flava]|uniref:hypothetical protein n=1 Tax=Desertimonas flava TaxID=2064846 RepID=UPI000E351ECF|nr:hypothetical protein [Desertimonas flava]
MSAAEDYPNLASIADNKRHVNPAIPEQCRDALAELDKLRGDVANLLAQAATAARTIAVTRFVADHWREALNASNSSRLCAHPLCMVLHALDGETDPVQMGIEHDAHAALAAVVARPPWPAEAVTE